MTILEKPLQRKGRQLSLLAAFFSVSFVIMKLGFSVVTSK